MKKYLLEQVGIYKKNWINLFDPKLLFIGLGLIPLLIIRFEILGKAGDFKIILDFFNYTTGLIMPFIDKDAIFTQFILGACCLFLNGLIPYSLIILFLNMVVLLSDLILVITTGKTGDALRIHKLGLELKRIQKLEEKEKRGY